MSDQNSAYINNIGGDVKGIIGDVKGGIVNQYIITRKSEAEIHSQRLLKGSPYLGLNKFEPEDKDKFFGRELWINKLSNHLEQNNLLLLLGASGSGKSSLVQAGIIPYLSDEWGTSQLVKLIFVPDKNPFASLYNSLPNRFTNTATKIIDQKNSDSLIKLIDELKENLHLHQSIVFIDQFEEIFTITPKLKREQFIANLVSLMKQRDSSVRLIIAMRSDFLDNLREYGDFTNEVESQIRLIRDMTESELRLAIAEPAARNGVTFEKSLVEQIVSDFYQQAGSLPLLQYTLDLLWREDKPSENNRVLNIATYQAIGGVSGALQKQANYIYNEKLNNEEKKAAEKIFIELIDIAAKEPVSRRIEPSQFRNDPVRESTLNKLIEYRLLVSGRYQSTVEVAHEELLRSWGFIQNLIREQEEIIILRSRLIGDANQWYELRKEDEQKAQDELWSGSKLGRVLELIDEKAFGSLDEESEQFIQASVEKRDRREREKKERDRRELKAKVDLETAQEKNQILAEANQKAKRRIRVGSIILVLSLFMGGIASYRIKLLNQVEKTLIATIGRLGIEKRDLLFYTFGDPGKAIDYLEKSLETARQIKDRRGESYALGNLGIAYYAQGDYGKAIDYHQQHLTIVREISDRQGETEALGNLGKIYFALGNYVRAIEYHEKHLEISQLIGNRQSEGQALGNLGTVYTVYRHPIRKERKKAIDYHQKHLAISRRIQDIHGEGQALGNLGITYQTQGEYAKAIKYHQKHLTISKEIQDLQGQGKALVNLGKAYLALGKIEQGIGYLQDGLKIARKIKDRSLEGIALANLGNSYLKSENFFLAEKNLRASIRVMESLRAGLEDIHKISILETQANIYRDLQKVLIALNKPDIALEISERMRARAFVELLEKQLLSKSDSKPTIQSPNIKQIKQVAKKHNATLVEYSIIYDEEQASELFIWVISPTGQIKFRQVDLVDKNIILSDSIRNFNGEMGIFGTVRAGITIEPKSSNNTRLWQSAQQLYQLLIEPIDELLPNDPTAHVIFIPHKEIFTVAFPTLQDAEGKYLIEKHTLLTAPAIQVLDFTYSKRQRIKEVEGNILIAANPTMPKTLPPLPGTQSEALEIARIFNNIPITVIMGNYATETTIVSKMPTSKIIHLATHVISTNLELLEIDTRAIVLSASESDDGFLTSEEIQELKLNAELVVVSGCETAIGKIMEEGVIGLSRSLISAGASSLILAVWKIPDVSTAFLMSEFYKNFQRNPDKAQALRQAMLTTMKKHPEPINWAGFTLIGEAI